MAVGDYASGIQPHGHYIHYWLNQIDLHWRDHDWLNRHQDRLFEAIRLGIHSKEPLCNRAVSALFSIMRYMLTRSDYRRWWKLCYDAFSLTPIHGQGLLLDIMVRLGQGHLMEGHTEGARRAFILVIRQASDRVHVEQAVLAYIGLLKAETWDYNVNFVTDKVIDEALALATGAGDRLLSELLYQALAMVYSHRGEMEKAIGLSQTSLGYAFLQRDMLHATITGLVLAIAYRRSGLYDRADDSLTFVEQMLRRHDQPQAAALVAYERGLVAYLRQDYVAARASVAKAIDGFRALGWKRHITVSIHLLGNIALELSAYTRAKRRLLRALNDWEHFGNVYEQARALHDLARLCQRSGDPKNAHSYIEQAWVRSAAIPAMHWRDGLVDQIYNLRTAILQDT